MFVHIQKTPNPQTLKFCLDHKIIDDSIDILNAETAKSFPITQNLFETNTVSSIFIHDNFISVTKKQDKDWELIKPEILTIISDYFIQNDVISITKEKTKQKTYSETEKKILELLDEKIRPAIAMDGGDIVFERYEEGTVYVKLHGACSGCPSASMTLKSGIENLLKFYIPEIKDVISV